ncbi:MAG: hypothetical protein ACI9K3_000927, partial [Halovenus sp.]
PQQPALPTLESGCSVSRGTPVTREWGETLVSPGVEEPDRHAESHRDSEWRRNYY